jgi:hypothetical protein
VVAAVAAGAGAIAGERRSQRGIQGRDGGRLGKRARGQEGKRARRQDGKRSGAAYCVFRDAAAKEEWPEEADRTSSNLLFAPMLT